MRNDMLGFTLMTLAVLLIIGGGTWWAFRRYSGRSDGAPPRDGGPAGDTPRRRQ